MVAKPHHPPANPIIWRAWTGTPELGEIDLGQIEDRLWYSAREQARRLAAKYGIEAVENARIEAQK